MARKDSAALEGSEFWDELHSIICNWHIALKMNNEEMSQVYMAQWEIAKKALKLVTGNEWYFTRSSEHFGVCTEDGKRFLIRYDA